MKRRLKDRVTAVLATLLMSALVVGTCPVDRLHDRQRMRRGRRPFRFLTFFA